MNFFAGQIPTAKELRDLATDGTYVPILTATSTNPTLGSGSIQEGVWHRNGLWIAGGAYIQFGSSGVNPGSGNFLVSLPFDADLSAMIASTSFWGNASVLGNGELRDDSGGATVQFRCSVRLFEDARVSLGVSEGTGSIVNDNSPWIWAAGDTITINFAYRADPAGLP